MALLALSHQTGRSIHVLSVDHGLRPEARAEAQRVAHWCAARAVPHTILTWSPPQGGGTLSEAARLGRYRLMADWCVEHGVPTLGVAHHGDDQAETVLMRLSRGAGMVGLAGMAECRPLMTARGDVTLIRPLLHSSKTALRKVCTAQQLPTCDDPTNADRAYDRVRARAILNEDAPLRARLLTLQPAMAALWGAIARDIDVFVGQHAQRTPLGPLRMDGPAFAALAPVMRRHVLGHLCRAFNPGRHAPSQAALEALSQHLVMGKGAHTLAGLLWVRQAKSDLLWAGREYRAVEKPLQIGPGQTAIWDRQWRIDGGEAGAVVGAVNNRSDDQQFEMIEKTGVPKPYWQALGELERPGCGAQWVGLAGSQSWPVWPQSALELPIALF